MPPQLFHSPALLLTVWANPLATTWFSFTCLSTPLGSSHPPRSVAIVDVPGCSSHSRHIRDSVIFSWLDSSCWPSRGWYHGQGVSVIVLGPRPVLDRSAGAPYPPIIGKGRLLAWSPKRLRLGQMGQCCIGRIVMVQRSWLSSVQWMHSHYVNP